MQQNTTPVQHDKLAYSIRELSKLVGICERKIYYEIEQGKLKISRIGRRILIRANEIDRWLQEAES
ncbi:MAG: helix-turn-helix domain-containing protein [Pyrinomonadaceae bacterium]|jgi:excisionase family DNA binding protein